ncbi:sorting nexin-20 isoform X2 [Xenopus laevis]|nr:sorting nexin-20 isoform X2 [Xenopus laevis]XP_018113291.1 sorting nexin-20 isoform X2 [Xenopus laevis]
MDTEQASKSLVDVQQTSSDSSVVLTEAGHSSDGHSAEVEEEPAHQCKGSSDSSLTPCQHYLMTTRELQMYWKKEKHSSKPDKLLFEIPSTRIAEDFLSKFVIYQIVIIRTGSFDGNKVFIERRYSDFEKLHRTLLKEFKEEMEDVLFPKKVLIGNLTSEMISKRMLGLKNYLDELYAIKCVRWSKIYIDFFLDPELDEGYSCLRGGQYKKAMEIFQQIVCLQEKLTQHCSILMVPPLCALVVCHKDLDNLEKAYDVGMNALTLVEKHPGHKYYTPLLDTLISLAYKLGKDFLSLREKFERGKNRMMKGHEIEMVTLKELAVKERHP